MINPNFMRLWSDSSQTGFDRGARELGIDLAINCGPLVGGNSHQNRMMNMMNIL
jgi:hypothetical protein